MIKNLNVFYVIQTVTVTFTIWKSVSYYSIHFELQVSLFPLLGLSFNLSCSIFDSINSCFLVLIMHSCLSHSTYHMDTWSFAGAPSTTREHVDTIVVYCTTSSVYFDGYHSPVSGGESKQHATRLAQAISAEP